MFALRGRQAEKGVKVVNALGKNAGEIDGIDGREPDLRSEGAVFKHRFHRSLGVVKAALDRKGKDIIRTGAGHLTLLQRRNASIGIENKSFDPFLTEEAVNRSGAGIAGSRTEDRDGASGAGDLRLVEIAEELQGKILEGESRPVEELQDVASGTQFPNRGNGGIVKFIVRKGNNTV